MRSADLLIFHDAKRPRTGAFQELEGTPETTPLDQEKRQIPVVVLEAGSEDRPFLRGALEALSLFVEQIDSPPPPALSLLELPRRSERFSKKHQVLGRLDRLWGDLESHRETVSMPLFSLVEVPLSPRELRQMNHRIGMSLGVRRQLLFDGQRCLQPFTSVTKPLPAKRHDAEVGQAGSDVPAVWSYLSANRQRFGMECLGSIQIAQASGEIAEVAQDTSNLGASRIQCSKLDQ